jgi:hypothetical protein
MVNQIPSLTPSITAADAQACSRACIHQQARVDQVHHVLPIRSYQNMYTLPWLPWTIVGHLPQSCLITDHDTAPRLHRHRLYNAGRRPRHRVVRQVVHRTISQSLLRAKVHQAERLINIKICIASSWTTST